jgi:hypothetical protein
VAQCVDAEAESRRKHLLRHSELRSDRLDVDMGRNMNAVGMPRGVAGSALFGERADEIDRRDRCQLRDLTWRRHGESVPASLASRRGPNMAAAPDLASFGAF